MTKTSSATKQNSSISSVRAVQTLPAQVLNALPDVIYWKDSQRRYLGANDAFIKVAGLKDISELIGLSDSQLPWGDIDREREREDLAILQAETDELSSVRNVETATGQVVLQTIKVPLRDENNKIIGILGTSRDITEEHNLRQEVTAAQQRSSLISDSAQIGLWEYDVVKDSMSVNERWAQILGYALAEVDDLTISAFFERVHPEDRGFIVPLLENMHNGQNAFEIEFRLIHKDGSAIWVRDCGQCVRRDQHGHASMIIGTIADITQAKQTQERLKLAEETTSFGSWDWVPEKSQLYTNAQFWAMLGEPAAKGVVSTSVFYDRLHPDDHALVQNELDRTLPDPDKIMDFECRLRHRDGHYIWVRSMGRVVERNEQGKPLRVLGHHIDINESHQREEALSKLSMALDFAGDGIFIFHPESMRFDYVNIKGSEQLGYAPFELKKISVLSSVAEADQEALLEIFSSLRLGPKRYRSFTTLQKHRSGKATPVSVMLRFVPEIGDEGRFVAIVHDISAQLARENALNRVRSAVDAAGDTLLVLNNTGTRIEFANETAARELGYSNEQLLACNPDELSLASGVSLDERIAQVLKSPDHIIRAEAELSRKDGTTFPVEFSYRALFDGEEFTRLVCVARNITEQRERERELAQKAVSLDVVGDMIWVISETDGRITYVNESTVSLTGLSRETWYQSTPVDVLDISPEQFRAQQQQLMSHEGEPLLLRTHLATAGEHKIPVEISVRYQRLGKDDAMYAAVLRDISEQVEQERTLQRYKAALDAAGDAVFLIDPGTAVPIYVNASACGSLEYTIEELCETPISSFSDKALDEVSLMVEKLNQDPGRTLRFDAQHVSRTGRRFPVQVSLSLLPDVGDSTTTLIAIARDVSEDREREQALHEAMQAAESANKAKSAFLANMSHEIRTPMNGIMGMTELLLGTDLTTEQREYTRTVFNSGKALVVLVNDILDLSKIEAERLQLDESAFQPRELIEEVLTLCQASARERGLDLHHDVAQAIPAQLIGDAYRLRQILLNLIGNAIKFTESGHVSVQVTCPERHEDKATLNILVRDTGIGIKPDAINRLFDRFEQADNSTTRRFGGTGLGLAICARLVELMGGTLRVESEYGRGSTFSFDICLSTHDALPVPKVIPRAIPGASIHGLRVLLVEDNIVNQTVARGMLKQLGCSTVTVDNGEKALQSLANDDFDIVLMDCQMPVLDGYSATEKLRAGDARTRNRNTTIIALTANAMEGDRERCLDAGMNDYLAKPIELKSLKEMLLRWNPEQKRVAAS